MANCIPLIFKTGHRGEEEIVAQEFCGIAREFFTDVKGDIYVLPNLRASREMDLVVWMNFDKYMPKIKTGYEYLHDEANKEWKYKPFKRNRDVWFNNCLLVIEIKKHDTSDSIQIQNGVIRTLQNGEFHDTSKQSQDQIYALKKYLMDYMDSAEIPLITNLIWLYRYHNNLPDNWSEVHNLMTGKLKFDSLLKLLCSIRPPRENSNTKHLQYSATNKPSAVEAMRFFFESRKEEKSNGLGQISRRKLNQIINKELDVLNSGRFQNLGDKLTVLNGKPGTGKTIHLINFAYHAKQESGFTPIILTYNKALSQDIDRLMYFSGYENIIEIQTLDKFFSDLMINIGLFTGDKKGLYVKNSGLSIYEKLLNDLNDLIDNSKSEKEWRKELKINYDLLFVDEAQDCREIERDLLFKLFGRKNTIISLGKRQLVRFENETNWTIGTEKHEREQINLSTSHRNKQNLTDWFNGFSKEHYKIAPWSLKENQKLTGGRLILTIENSYTKAFHITERDRLIKNENSLYDLMFLTPNKSSKVNYNHEISNKLSDWNIPCFDFNAKENYLERFPIDRHRIMNFHSCRGLESWTLVLWKLDIVIQNIKQEFQANYPDLPQDKLNENVNNWLLMIFTRSIDTLIIVFENQNSEEYALICELIQSAQFEHMSKIKMD